MFGGDPSQPYPAATWPVPIKHGQDLEKAKKLLTEAGFPNGFKTTLWCGAVDKDRAVTIQAQLKQIGVEAEVVQMEEAALDAEYGKPVEESQKEMRMTGF